MPRKRSSLSSTSLAAKRVRNSRSQESARQREERLATNRQRAGMSREDTSEILREQRLTKQRERIANLRARESHVARDVRLEAVRRRQVLTRANETAEEGEARLADQRDRQSLARANETAEEGEARLADQRDRQALTRANETTEQEEARLADQRDRQSLARANETAEEGEARLADKRDRQALARANETPEEGEARLADQRDRQSLARANETAEEGEARLADQRDRQALTRANETTEQEEARLADQRDRQALTRANETTEQEEARLADQRDRQSLARSNETAEEGEARLADKRDRQAWARANETAEQEEARLADQRDRQSLARANESAAQGERRRVVEIQRYRVSQGQQILSHERETNRLRVLRRDETNEQRMMRLAHDRERHGHIRLWETNVEREARQVRERERHDNRNRIIWGPKFKSGFIYNPLMDYQDASSVGSMDVICKYCNALKFQKEPAGLCCSSGKVRLQPLSDHPEPLKSLLESTHPQSRHFLSNIRAYNCAFQMTSFGAQEIRERGYMPTFKVQGQVYHLIGSLLPLPEKSPSFLQIYFVSDSAEQARVRLSAFNELNLNLIQSIQNMLHEHNPYIRDIRTAIESIPSAADNDYNIVIRADRVPSGEHPGRFNAPTINEVAVLMVGEPSDKRDIVLRTRQEGLKRICETHRSYDALQYPLMFCKGDDGYHFGIRHVNPETGIEAVKKISAHEFYSYRIMVRRGSNNYLQQFRQLFNQYLVDEYAKIESERLLFIKLNQKKLRSEEYIHLQDALRQESAPEDLGRVVILPSSFTGGPRYMHSRTQDAFCYVRKFGRPDLFITMTTNPNWREIKENIGADNCAQNRYDIVSRVFHLKLKCLMALLTKGKIFGTVRCFMYSVEWQKRGLPHTHILIWLEEPIRPERIDDVIKAEFPDSQIDPELFAIVKGHMVHGPCGPFNPHSACMRDGHCTKKYPRKFVNATITGEDGYPTYRRRDPNSGGFTALMSIKGELIRVDNRWIVPFSPVLSRTFCTHINVEYCSSVRSIKYICKYVNKGSDQASFAVQNEHDEVAMYQTGRYISSSEAVWRILAFHIHERYPSVMHLAVHLENGQRVYFQPHNVLDMIENPRNTTLMAFFNLCQIDDFAKTILYCDVPTYYTFNKLNGKFSRRKIGTPVDGFPGVKKDSVIGRVFTVHPNNSECYHLRLLLHAVRGPISFETLRTVDGIAHTTYQSACRALGLLQDDNHWHDTLREASLRKSPSQLRELFSVMVVFCNLSDPLDLWNKFNELLAEDYLREEQRIHGSSQLHFNNTPQLFHRCLSNIQEIVSNIGGMKIDKYGLPPVPSSDLLNNIDYHRETTYDVMSLTSYVGDNEKRLTQQQRDVYNAVLFGLNEGMGRILFLDAPGGTGKTYLIKLVLAKVRSEGYIALAVASSGIAATLLPGGRTAHSMFKIPLDVDRMENPICNLSRNSPMARVLQECKIIIWDESTMAHRKGIEALDNSLKDIKKNNKIMGGITVLFSGDFRQTLPIVAGGTRADEIQASMKKSYLWPLVQRYSLNINMRVRLDSGDEGLEFSSVLLRLGNGTLPILDGCISIPNSLATIVESQEDLITCVFPGITNLHVLENSWLCERAILTPTNEQASEINKKIMSLFCGQENTYHSVNTVLNQDDAIHYPSEFLNSIATTGLPAHEIKLKIGVPIILMRNLRAPKLCNGTRLRVTALHQNVIEAVILTGIGAGESVFIPRIPLVPNNYPFQFKRIQFPVSVCFAMTINKSQGQTLSTAGIELGTTGCFSHGQLYVACSRVRSPRSLYIHAPQGKTPNIVYSEALQ